MRRPIIVGILNVTPDSFSDGGLYRDLDSAVAHASRMVEDGAEIIDVGGESTRPGAFSVYVDEELRRTIPVVSALVAQGIRVSIDTSKAAVARAALEAGAEVVNDISALSDPEMAGVVAGSGASLCLMHMQGNPRTMQKNPHYSDVVLEVREFLMERVEFALTQGVAKDKIWLDPGIGFGKSRDHNVALLAACREFSELGFPLMIGVSRKSVFAQVLGREVEMEDRIAPGVAVQLECWRRGATYFRTHDVRPLADAFRISEAIWGAE